MQILQIGNNNICSIGVRHLSKANWQALNNIYIHQNRLNDDSVGQLIKSNWLNIRIIDLDDNLI